MIQQPTGDELQIWDHLVENYLSYLSAAKKLSSTRSAFLMEGVDRIALMRRALNGVKDAPTAVYIARFMKVEELIILFNEWIKWIINSAGLGPAAREIVLSMPRDWVLANIESAVEPFLRSGTDFEYARILEFYVSLDRDLALNLARRAKEHYDPSIREVGEDFLTKLNAK